MADFNLAFQWTMQFEDPRMECAQVPDVPPAGVRGPCFAISGINSGAWPADFATISAMPQNARKPAVEAFYQSRFWNNWFAQLSANELAMRVFDFAVNGGSGTAVRILQQAVNTLGGSLTLDGGWGPLTVAAVNAANQQALLQAFKSARAMRYEAIAAATPASAQYLSAWLKRAQL